MRTLESVANERNMPLNILLRNCYDQHKTVKKVAQELRFHRKTVERKFRKLNIPLIYKSEIISQRNYKRNYLTIIEKIFKKQTKKTLINLLNNKKTIKEIARELKISYPTVVYTFKKYNIKNKFKNNYLSEIKQIKIKPNSLQTKFKAFIFGCLCGDASLSHPKDREKDYYNLNLWSRDKEFIQFFQKSLKRYYNYETNLRENKDSLEKIYFSTSTATKQITKDLLKEKDFKTKSWRIPKEILKGKKPEVSMFIKGLLNSDGHVTKYEIIFSSVNLEGLNQLKELLQKNNTISKIRKGRTTYNLAISHKNNLKQFLILLKDSKYLIKRKKERLEVIRRRINED